MDLFRELRNMKILLIDDDEWVRDSMSLLFEGEGCQILTLETGEEALKALKETNYHIIIADYRLPGMDGLDLLREVHKSHPETIRILITAYGSKAVISEATQMGIDEFVNKPFTSAEIEACLSRVIQRRKGPKGERPPNPSCG